MSIEASWNPKLENMNTNKRAIVTYVTGDIYEEQLEVSEPLFKQYADKCKADLIIFREDLGLKGVECKHGVYPIFKDYGRCLFFDVDIIPQYPKSIPDIFDFTPIGFVSGVDEFPHLHHYDWFLESNRPDIIRKTQLLPEVHQKMIINSGFFTIDKSTADLYRPPDHPISFPILCSDQGLLSVRLQESGLFNPISLRWNCLSNFPCFNHERKEAYFIHFNLKPFSERLRLMKEAAISQS